MDERQKELMYLIIGVSLCASVLSYNVYMVYLSHQEYTVEFRVFETNYWDVNNKAETQILTWGVGKFYFLGNWTGQFIEGNTYRVTYVQRAGHAKHSYNNLIVLEWEEIT